MTHQRLTARIRGRVKGVGFRRWVKRHAEPLGLTGWVRNEPEGVRVVAEGPKPMLQTLLADLHRGPALAHVRTVEPTWSAATGTFSAFEVNWG